ncbi:uncharacterized protein N7483_000056 [Penicillium malachiteum]|uniref:uncharacterized protein n=1 Tax=Penicillium malachiteum TaxID=1324776 RepID=UPI002548AE01|nr:uncharacterized protein N7483_000056 [Penicillium malachiteum]KAJ5734931.1 hypothetical protein N7483_000056 [Penicillium malachiteum]
MANPPRSQQVPQHVTALLSHLTSRPGVQSTLILSRKDGSIIQSTGQLAIQEGSQSRPAPITVPPTEPVASSQPSDSTPPSPGAPAPSTYQPSQTEALAAHIFAFVSSASALGVSLSRPVSQTQQSSENHTSTTTGLDGEYGSYGTNGTSTPREEDRDGDSLSREEDEEVKLLRMRTRKHEIVVVPDRKYLLCVVHDASHASSGPGTGVGRSR